MNEDICQINCVDQQRVSRVLQEMPERRKLSGAADIFRVLGDPTRVHLLHALILEEELCVCDLAALARSSQSAVSHQLRLLRVARLVKSRRSGKMIYYSLDDDHVRSLLEEGLRHAEEG